jgi:hypothetical protein
MISIADGSVHIQTSAESQPAPPSWLGEVALVASHLRTQGLLNMICECVRCARRRFGRYDVVDFLAVLFGYAISGERTLEDFYETVRPFASTFMALFGRTRLPAASTLSRFLAALPAEPVEALRTLFLEDLLARRLSSEEHSTGLWDRQGNRYLVFDVDGTRKAARQRALPQTPDRPAPPRRLRPLCAPGYTGRKRGEVVRTRTTVLQMHTHQWVAIFGNPGNGHYREELRRAKAAIQTYVKVHHFPEERTLLRLDGQVSVLLHPLTVGSAPLLWRDWNRRHQRQACLRLHRQRLDIQSEPGLPLTPTVSPPTISRAQRAHYRLSWNERLARNARSPEAAPITITLFGIPEIFARLSG